MRDTITECFNVAKVGGRARVALMSKWSACNTANAFAYSSIYLDVWMAALLMFFFYCVPHFCSTNISLIMDLVRLRSFTVFEL